MCTTASIMMLPLVLAAASGMSIVLRFDGSLRPPSDPIPGFTYSPIAFDGDSSKKPLAGSEKLASCSAAISICEGDGGEERLLAMGGRYLPNDVPGMTSADAEYDGLLLGLERLVQAFLSEDEGECITQFFGENEHRPSSAAHPPLIIRGDCKAVIDQLKLRSKPRKTETKHEMAVSMIESLKTLYTEHWQRTDDARAARELSVSYEHVLREENSFSDAICRLIVNQKQVEMVRSICNLILKGGEEASSKANDEHAKHTKRPKKKKNIPVAKSGSLQEALSNIQSNPQLCHSSRIALACVLAKASIRQRDGAMLSCCGDFFMRMSRAWPRVYYGEDTRASVGRDTLKKVGIGCKNVSNQLPSEAVQEEQEESGLVCDMIESIFGFCTANRLSRGEETVDSPFNAILEAYNDITVQIDSVEEETWRDEEQAWSEIALADSPARQQGTWKQSTCTQT